jgi:hypothetical protein
LLFLGPAWSVFSFSFVDVDVVHVRACVFLTA